MRAHASWAVVVLALLMARPLAAQGQTSIVGGPSIDVALVPQILAGSPVQAIAGEIVRMGS